MPDLPPSSPISRSPVPDGSDAQLTPAQIEFACILGRLLAEMWDRKDESPNRPTGSNVFVLIPSQSVPAR